MIRRALYAPGTAALMAMVSGAALAASQTRAIVDAVAIVHPAWSPVWHWTAAVGFEAAILAVGLVMATTGDRGLWRWEMVLVGVSVVAGVMVAMDGRSWSDPVALVRAAATGVMPVQYLAVVMTAHRLAGRAGVTTVAADQPATTATTPPAATATTTPRPRPAARQTSTGPAADPRVAAAIAAGVPRTTARRWAATGDHRLDRYRAEVRAA